MPQLHANELGQQRQIEDDDLRIKNIGLETAQESLPGRHLVDVPREVGRSIVAQERADRLNAEPALT